MPQGSVLEPMLFLLYINNINNEITSQIKLFADDGVLYRNICDQNDRNQNGLTDLFNSSLASGISSQCFKSALVMPILKKRCLDHNDLNNYRPVSNPCFIAKILEKLVLSHVSSYLNSHNLCNTCQSAYRPGHSTETALLKVINDLFLSLDKGSIFVLALLYCSSAFDVIDHPILVHHLHTDFGFTDTVLQWFCSYLTDRTNYVSLSNHCSAFAPVHSGVPQGTVHGPIHVC